jgi:hypothetical protein
VFPTLRISHEAGGTIPGHCALNRIRTMVEVNSMTKLRRATAVLVLLQFLLLIGTGSGLLQAAASHVNCGEKAMETTLSISSTGHDHGTANLATQSDSETIPPCRLPWAPSGCAAGAACLPTMLATAAPDRAVFPGLSADAAAVNDQLPHSALPALEPPPPRS